MVLPVSRLRLRQGHVPAKSPRQDPSGALRHLQRYWHDFGDLGEKHLDEVALWGRHLAFAVALGDATLARRELHDDYERLGRLAESLMVDDQELYLADSDVGDGRSAEWLRRWAFRRGR